MSKRKVSLIENKETGKDDLRRKLSRRQTPKNSSSTRSSSSSFGDYVKTSQIFGEKLAHADEQIPAASSRRVISATDLPNCGRKRSFEGQHDYSKTKNPERFKRNRIEYPSSSTVTSTVFSDGNLEKQHLHPLSHIKEPCHDKIPQASGIKTLQGEMVQAMGYKCAENLCKLENPDETALKLTMKSTFERFEALLSEKDIRYDLMKVIVSLIEIVCQSRVETYSNKVLGIMQKTNFWDTLSKFVDELFSTKEANDDPCLSTLIINLCKIFSLCLDRLPDLHSTIPILQLLATVQLFKVEEKFDDVNIEQHLEELNTKRQRIMKEKRVKVSSQMEPPDDFRKLSVFPSRQDIFFRGKPFLRENLVGTPYPNVDHYLDVQFRLLKEDSLADLRNNIRKLKNQDKMRELQGNSSCKSNNDGRKDDVKVFHNVKINDVALRRNFTSGIVYNVSFDSSHHSIKRTNWKRSKRLLFGSLVCLISDNFERLYFATVQNRDPESLKAGLVQLCFEGWEDVAVGYDNQQSFRMVESSSAYFVAYRHILKQLQDITEETMPFKDYVIACNREIKQPAYLKTKDADGNSKMIDFTSIVEKSILQNQGDEINLEALKNVDPDDLSTWPDANVLGLNDPQYNAFQSALCKEFVMIQGPPGTGKTYLGLKIAHVLLANCHLWKDYEGKSCPILMLSFTNHALDQFLEGLTIDKTYIIRAGGRSESKHLESCNLSVVRRATHHGLKNSQRRRLCEVERDLEECQRKLRKYTNIYTQSFEGILQAHAFEEKIKKCHAVQLSNNKDMIKFLSINLKSGPRNKRTVVNNLEEENNEFAPKDNEGQFSAGRFAHIEDEDSEFKFDKAQLVVCLADETTMAKKLRDKLKQDQDSQDHDHAFFLENAYLSGRLWQLRLEDRWCLYQLWLSRLREHLHRNMVTLQNQHLELSVNREELRNIEDLSILMRAHVIGMTTTWASKNNTLLRQLRPRVIIIEEAAEVFEGHVVSSLAHNHCQHLILIGDHQQLRPNPSVYKSVKFNLDVSLFERMIKCGVPFDQLNVQHRMRPEISQIVRRIYNDLQDHDSVTKYENVKGISKNLFFVDHSNHEGISSSTHSKTNDHEASFLIALCYYLLRQGYDASQITILTTYTGQMFAIRDQLKSQWWCSFDRSRLPRVSSVDNFQGEENDIILLSLVRSNKEENIGFLKTSNRVCVALSRAKKGFYIIGNKAILVKQSPLWKAILDDFQNNDCVGKCLPLVCSNHGNENHVSSAEDFKEKVPNGGCLEICQHRLKCGHACPQMCHSDDHESYQCQKPCEKNVTGCQLEGHKCQKKCCEPCDYKCNYPVEKQLGCGHLKKLPCSDDKNLAKCIEQCEKTLCCGHRCQTKCGVACQPCMELVKKTDWPCSHENTIACSSAPKDCKVPCCATLECGHDCPGKCGPCIQGRVHMKCKEKCKRILICSHVCKANCTKNCPPCKEQCLRKCDHSKCRDPCGKVCNPCKEPCQWECEHFKCTKLCNEMCDRSRCDKPCKRKLLCEKRSKELHDCCGLCGERCICKICTKQPGSEEPITDILFGTEEEENARFIRLKDCEHVFEVTGLDRYIDGDDGDNEIKVKVCPKCKTPIEKTWRYGNIVKTMHKDIDNVKRKILADGEDFDDRKKLVKKLIIEIADEITLTTAIFSLSKNRPLKNVTMEFLEKASQVNYHEVLLMESQVRLLRNWLLVKKSHKDATNTKSPGNIEFIDCMQNIWQRLMVKPNELNVIILNDLRLELERMSLKRDVLVLHTKLANIGGTLEKTEEECIKEVIKTLNDKAKIEYDFIGHFKQEIADIYKKHPQLGPITPEEKVEIVNAIGLKQGHWFKCPQGHFYAIGDCGGAMEKSRCPGCDAVIGGQQHRLEDGNELATEMDGARHAAWSEQANLGNYQM